MQKNFYDFNQIPKRQNETITNKTLYKDSFDINILY